MLELYDTFTNAQKNTFAEVCNKLLSNTYLARDKRDNKEAYYFVVSYKDLFEEYFKLMNMQLVLNRDLGTITLENTNTQTILKLKRDESVILLIIRLLYHEKLKETSINTNVVATLADLHAKYDMLEIKRKINKTDLIAMIRMFRRYNLIEPMGDLNNSNTQFIIFPTILEALKTDQIDAVYNTINKLVAEGGNE
jgi:hypothetical protein